MRELAYYFSRCRVEANGLPAGSSCWIMNEYTPVSVSRRRNPLTILKDNHYGAGPCGQLLIVNENSHDRIVQWRTQRPHRRDPARWRRRLVSARLLFPCSRCRQDIPNRVTIPIHGDIGYANRLAVIKQNQGCLFPLFNRDRGERVRRQVDL